MARRGSSSEYPSAKQRRERRAYLVATPTCLTAIALQIILAVSTAFGPTASWTTPQSWAQVRLPLRQGRRISTTIYSINTTRSLVAWWEPQQQQQQQQHGHPLRNPGDGSGARGAASIRSGELLIRFFCCNLFCGDVERRRGGSTDGCPALYSEYCTHSVSYYKHKYRLMLILINTTSIAGYYTLLILVVILIVDLYWTVLFRQ